MYVFIIARIYTHPNIFSTLGVGCYLFGGGAGKKFVVGSVATKLFFELI
jgi:hypothetical protein